MAEAYELTIDVETLRQHFIQSDSHLWTADEVRAWLRECGFKPNGEAWIAEEISFDVLDKSEYEIVRRL